MKIRFGSIKQAIVSATIGIVLGLILMSIVVQVTGNQNKWFVFFSFSLFSLIVTFALDNFKSFEKYRKWCNKTK